MKSLKMLTHILTSITSAGDDTDMVIYASHKFPVSTHTLTLPAALYSEHILIFPGHSDERLLIS